MALDAEAVWQLVHDRLRAFVAKGVPDQADVDDVIQEIFLRLHQSLDALRDSSKVMPWLYRIAHRAVVDHYRVPSRRREQPAGLAVEVEAHAVPSRPSSWRNGPDSAELRAELAGCLAPMIGRLAQPYREAVTLVELEGLTSKAAAGRLGLSESGVKSRVQRGRHQLKKLLDACCSFEFDRRRRVTGYRVRAPRCSSCR
jgi:RNA polymerase sigma-70 factor (ECF subfamily)